MGVKLADLVTKKPLSFDELAGKRIALDFSNSAYQFLSSIRQPDGTALMDKQGRITSHLVGIWSRFTNLIQRNIKIAVVLDGVPPLHKQTEAAIRYARKERAEGKYLAAKEEEDTEMMGHYAKQFTRLTKEMTHEAEELLHAMGIPVIQAPQEADAQMAYMSKQDDVWGCGSSDYDCLLHGAPRLINNLTLSQRRRLPSGVVVKITPELLELQTVLEENQITRDQLIYIALLIGTDYNTGVHGIGPKKALNLVKKHQYPEIIFKETKADFDWKEVYDLFTNMKVEKEYYLTWKSMDIDRVKEILVEEHDFSEDRIDATLKKSQKASSAGQKGLSEWMK